MNPEHQQEELIDLGAVTVETKGPYGVVDETQGGLMLTFGLSNE